MVETLTESFCERCGTRYEFRAPTRLNPLRKTRGFIGGLKNYLTSQDALSDALGDAMRSEEDQLASAQLEAFHETFSFCIGCRQYTCLNCWNDDAGRCRSCAPIAGTDDLAERLAAVRAGLPLADASAPQPPAQLEPVLEQDELSRRLGIGSWPSTDPTAMPFGTNRGGHAWPAPDEVGAAPEQAARVSDGEATSPIPTPQPEAEPLVAPKPEPEPEPIAAEVVPEPAPAPAPVVQPEPEPEPEPIAAEIEPEEAPVAPLRVVAWDADAAYDLAPPVQPAPVIEPEPEPMPMVAETAAELEPDADDAVDVPPAPPEPPTTEAEPEVLMPRVAPISETILRFPSQPAAAPAPVPEEAAAAASDSPELAARRAQLDLLGLGDPGDGPIERQGPAVLPYRSRGAAPTPAEMAAHAAGGSFWEASAREVAGATAHVGVQNCGECGLSLSATARFCRRCGTRQARSA